MDLKDDLGRPIKVSNLAIPISLTIPRTGKTPEPGPGFVRNDSLAYHTFEILDNGTAVAYFVYPSSGAISVYVKFNQRPTVIDYDLVFTVPTDCTTPECNPNRIFLSSRYLNTVGIYYFGIKLGLHKEQPTEKEEEGEEEGEEEAHSRKRRDCSGHRVRRDCIKYRNPPPTTPPLDGKAREIIPQYDPLLDTNYTYSMSVLKCQFWDEINSKWDTKGCEVSEKTTNSTLVCDCTHLTSFGGGILVKPNPLDFDKVFAGFANIGENVAVLAVLIGIFLVYSLVVVYARRVDRKEKNARVQAEKTIGSKDLENPFTYRISIFTGMKTNSGTTSNTGISLVGHKGTSGSINITNINQRLFARASIVEFDLKLPDSLGKLKSCRIWHDNSGPNPSWFVSRVIVKEKAEQTENDKEHVFLCEQWLAVESMDARIDRVLYKCDSKDVNTFQNLFFTKVNTDLFDGHLWFSVVYKPPYSNFTRVQRASCCLSLLCLTMITTCMFYNSTGAPDANTFELGPFIISPRQIIIGIQSAFIVLPISILLVQIFRKFGNFPNEDNDDDETPSEDDTFDEEGGQKKKKSLSMQCGKECFLYYLAWVLCISSAVTSALFTLFYSMAWGKETSEKWLTSITVSFLQDNIVTQPFKVCLLAIIISFILHKLSLRKKKQIIETEGLEEDDEVFERSTDNYMPINKEMIRKYREKRLKEIRMYSIFGEIGYFLVFITLLIIVAYGQRDHRSILLKDEISTVFDMSSITDILSFWDWAEFHLVPQLYVGLWYNGMKMKKGKEEDLISDRNSILVGMPRLRQLRVKKDTCTVYSKIKHLFDECDYFYSTEEEKEDSGYYIPGWKKLPVNTTKEEVSYTICPKSWRFQSESDLNTLPFRGKTQLYGGGGYVAELGYYAEKADEVLNQLKDYDWIDQNTRAVMVEFTVFNAYTNLFSVQTLLTEFQPTGGALTWSRVDIIRLYRYVGRSSSVVIACELLVVVFIFFFLYREIKILKSKGKKKYFTSFWSWVSILQISLTFCCIGLYFVEMVKTNETIDKIQDNPFLFVSFSYNVYWNDLNVTLFSFIVYLTFLKFLLLFRFNRFVPILILTIKRASTPLSSFMVFFLIYNLAFTSFAYLVFGCNHEIFSTIMTSIESMFSILLGDKIYRIVSSTNAFLGPIFYISFSLLMPYIIMNVFVAILMDTHVEVQEEYRNVVNEDTEMAEFMLQYFNELIQSTTPQMPTTITPIQDSEAKQEHNDDDDDDDEDTFEDEHQYVDLSSGKEYEDLTENTYETLQKETFLLRRDIIDIFPLIPWKNKKNKQVTFCDNEAFENEDDYLYEDMTQMNQSSDENEGPEPVVPVNEEEEEEEEKEEKEEEEEEEEEEGEEEKQTTPGDEHAITGQGNMLVQDYKNIDPQISLSDNKATEGHERMLLVQGREDNKPQKVLRGGNIVGDHGDAVEILFQSCEGNVETEEGKKIEQNHNKLEAKVGEKKKVKKKKKQKTVVKPKTKSLHGTVGSLVNMFEENSGVKEPESEPESSDESSSDSSVAQEDNVDEAIPSRRSSVSSEYNMIDVTPEILFERVQRLCKQTDAAIIEEMTSLSLYMHDVKKFKYRFM